MTKNRLSPPRGVLNKLDDKIPDTGIVAFDQLAVRSGNFQTKLDAIRLLGYSIVEDSKFLARGAFDPHAKTFTYNPTTMSRLDWTHEWRHYKQLRRLEKAGLSSRDRGFAAAEVGAYRYEQRLWSRIGVTPNSEYLSFHFEQLDDYLSIMNTRRVQDFLRYHPEYARIFR